MVGFVAAVAAWASSPVQFVVEGGGTLVLERTDVHAVVQLGLAVVEVRQLYHNPFHVPIDATYLFPLPEDAAVRAMSFTCGGRRIDSHVLPREEARQRYEEAAAQGKKAALLEQHRPNLLQQSVSSLCPGEDVVVELQYVDPLEVHDGRTELVFPTTVGPRYRPGDVPEPPFVSGPGHDLSVGVDIAEGLVIDSLWSDSHAIEIVEETEEHLWVKLADEITLPDKDFHLAWTFAGPEPRLTAAAIPPTEEEDGYLALTIAPGVVEDLQELRPRELMFVLDTSCSMKGSPHAASVQTVRTALARMRPTDTFSLVRFSDQASALFDSPRPATPENVAAAEQWLQIFDGGGTEMTAGIIEALTMPGDPERLRLVLLLTDGFIGDEDQVLREVRGHLGEARLFSLGVGPSVNRFLLDALADEGRGAVAYQLPDTPIEETVEQFYERIAHPVLTDLSIDFGDLRVSEVYPSQIPDLFAGQPVHVVARWSGGPVDTLVRLTGRTTHDEYTVTRRLVLQDAAYHEALPTLWARRKLADLQRTHRAAPLELATLSTEVAMQHHLASPYTSLVAIADRPSSCGPSRVRAEVPAMLPEGMGQGTGSFGAKGSGGIGAVGGIPMVVSSMDTNDVDEVIKRHMNAIRYCYQRELQKRPSLQGSVVVKFTIGSDGRVATAELESSTLHDEVVEQCILTRFQRMIFAPVRGGGVVVVSYPLRFTVAG
jgi:Ca-activated chloride channel family protein